MRRSTDHLTDRRIRSLKAAEGQRVEVMDGGAPGAVPGLASWKAFSRVRSGPTW
jgi:hypothetical protein